MNEWHIQTIVNEAQDAVKTLYQLHSKNEDTSSLKLILKLILKNV